MARVLVVDDKELMRESIELTLRRNGHQVVTAVDGRQALEVLAGSRFDLLISDLKMPGMDGVTLLEQVKSRWNEIEVILITAFGTVDVAVRAMKLGAFDFIQKPFKADQLLLVVERTLERRRLRSENEALRSQLGADRPLDLIGVSESMQRLRRQIGRVAGSPATVLIHGESGVGKEVVARMIHSCGDRADKPILCVNCAALSAGLLESELFGHERGAFTGADRSRKGRFELADGGTILLDEVSEIEPRLQAKLLRVLQEQEFERVGSSETIRVDARVIATTNRNLGQAVGRGEFREDLYYRLNVVPIVIPPLRQRREDVPVLAEHFRQKFSGRDGRIEQLSPDCLGMLSQYDWPGNVRELAHLVERACVLGLGPTLTAEDVSPWLSGSASTTRRDTELVPGTPLEEMERRMIRATLEKFGGHRANTAEALGISVRSLSMKIKSFNLADVGRALRQGRRQDLPVEAQ